MLAVASGPRELVASGIAQVMTSGDGQRWSVSEYQNVHTDAVLALPDGSWLLAGNSGILRSRDARTWETIFEASLVLGLAGRDDGAVVAVGTATENTLPEPTSRPAIWVAQAG